MSGIKAGSWGKAFFQTERQAEAIVPFLSPSPTEPQSQQVGAITETPSTWLTLFAPPWRSPETPSHPTYGATQTVNHDLSI